MFRLATVATLLAGSLSLAAAQSQSYADFTLDTTVATTFAGTLDALGTFNGDVETNRAACNALDNCIGFICQTSANNCILLAVGDETNSADAGFDSIHWKFDAAEGPSCSSAINTIPNPDGLCVCDFDTQEQNTAFGCAARLLPSQAVTRRRIARNRIMPGMVKKAFFEEQRRNIRTGRTLQAADI